MHRIVRVGHFLTRLLVGHCCLRHEGLLSTPVDCVREAGILLLNQTAWLAPPPQMRALSLQAPALVIRHLTSNRPLDRIDERLVRCTDLRACAITLKQYKLSICIHVAIGIRTTRRSRSKPPFTVRQTATRPLSFLKQSLQIMITSINQQYITKPTYSTDASDTPKRLRKHPSKRHQRHTIQSTFQHFIKHCMC